MAYSTEAIGLKSRGMMCSTSARDEGQWHAVQGLEMKGNGMQYRGYGAGI